MKKILMTATVFALSATMLLATSNKPESQILNKQLKRKINYPEFARATRMQGTVLVKFEVNANGNLIIDEINASNDQLESYVKNKLNDIRVNDMSAQGIHYVKFNFKYVEM